MNDITVEHGVQIQIKNTGEVIWINIDGVCRLRINNNKLKDIEIEDNRDLKDWPENESQLKINWEKQIEGRKDNAT